MTNNASYKGTRSVNLPLAKDIDDFQFDGALVNEILVRDLAGGNFLAHQRNCVLVGGPSRVLPYAKPWHIRQAKCPSTVRSRTHRRPQSAYTR